MLVFFLHMSQADANVSLLALLVILPRELLVFRMFTRCGLCFVKYLFSMSVPLLTRVQLCFSSTLHMLYVVMVIMRFDRMFVSG